MRLRVPVVVGEAVTPLQRVAAAADFGNGISSVVDWDDGWLFINPDLTVYLHRLPRRGVGDGLRDRSQGRGAGADRSPGRGLTQSKLHFLAALPRIDGKSDPASLGEGVDDLVRRVRAAWRGPTGPKLRLLPDEIGLDAIRAQATARWTRSCCSSASTRRSWRRSRSTRTASRTS